MTMTAIGDGEAPVFEAVIVPHRSLSPRGVRWLLLAVFLICAVTASSFALLGAWPVGGFCGVELLLTAGLLRINARAARASEVLLLTPTRLRVLRTDPRGRTTEVRMESAWLGVVLEDRGGRVPGLLLVAGARREEVGGSLGEAEKRSLAQAIEAALYRWRNPVFDNPQLREPPHPAEARGDLVC
jgi:uncharacterized membrane protein